MSEIGVLSGNFWCTLGAWRRGILSSFDVLLISSRLRRASSMNGFRNKSTLPLLFQRRELKDEILNILVSSRNDREIIALLHLTYGVRFLHTFRTVVQDMVQDERRELKRKDEIAAVASGFPLRQGYAGQDAGINRSLAKTELKNIIEGLRAG